MVAGSFHDGFYGPNQNSFYGATGTRVVLLEGATGGSSTVTVVGAFIVDRFAAAVLQGSGTLTLGVGVVTPIPKPPALALVGQTKIRLRR